jgi:hypothetical protein
MSRQSRLNRAWRPKFQILRDRLQPPTASLGFARHYGDEARETHLTVLVFAAVDPTATASMAKTYRALGDRVDYFLVKNPARLRSHAFDESALAGLFQKNKVPVRVPPPPHARHSSVRGLAGPL